MQDAHIDLFSDFSSACQLMKCEETDEIVNFSHQTSMRAVAAKK
jgi:hypothetical protein